jgi:hypothetical protein
MAHGVGDLSLFGVLKKNKQGTDAFELTLDAPVVNQRDSLAAKNSSGRCSFVVAEQGRGVEGLFCGELTLPGLAYCARHQSLCVVKRASAEGRALEAAQLAEADAAPEPPMELAHLAASALPEPLADDPRELRVLLDHTPPEAGTIEQE